MTDASSDGDSEDQWRFSLEDLEGDDEDSGGNITGAFTPSEELEPGDVDLENALFVVLGVAAMLLVVAGFVVTMTG